MNKRQFLKTSSVITAGSLLQFSAINKIIAQAKNMPEDAIVRDETYWDTVRRHYNLKDEYVNLENGYYNIMPVDIQDKYLEHIKEVNKLGAYYMRTVQWENKKRINKKLADLAGCSTEELIITRNTTESLDMVISGLDWKKGDEAVWAEQDYGAMKNMFRQVSERYDMKNVIVSVPQHPKTDEEIVDLYAKAITPKTKLLMICHMINITGHVLPVKKICDMAHKKGVTVMVDGAHTFAHLDFKIPDLGADFYGASLHKWLSAPLGCGILYVKKEHIKKVWPLFAEDPKDEDDILRLNHTGTHPVATDLAIENAIDFYNLIGPRVKEERLRYLQQYWTKQIRNFPKVDIATPEQPERACAIANVGIKGMKPKDMANILFKKYGIYTVAIDNAGVHGCRITPNIFTNLRELDTLAAAVTDMAPLGFIIQQQFSLNQPRHTKSTQCHRL